MIMEPTTAPRTPAQHTARMVAALKHVSPGRYSGTAGFVQQMTRNSANNIALTPRQQWWLTTLVVKYRKQLKLPSELEALEIAQQWLRDNAEPITPVDTGHKAARHTPHATRYSPQSRA